LIKFINLKFKRDGKPPKTSLDFYDLKKLVGKGAFGKVHLGV